MTAVRKPERTQRERRETTTRALIEAARKRFAEVGYAATSLDDIASDAGVSKGAVYHHFTGGKAEVFGAVYEDEEKRIGMKTAAAFMREKDPWKGLDAGLRAFFDEIFDPGTQRIMLIDGPGVLGADALREMQQRYSVAQMKQALSKAMDEGIIARRPVDLLAHMLCAAACEAATLAARSSDPRSTGKQGLRELRILLESMRIR